DEPGRVRRARGRHRRPHPRDQGPPARRRVGGHLAEGDEGHRHRGDVRRRRTLNVSFVGGKGGVGKTTCAAIRALTTPSRTAARRTLLVTTDPASSLSAALRIDVAAAPEPVRGAKGVFAANVDAARAFQRWLAPRKALLAQIAVRG